MAADGSAAFVYQGVYNDYGRGIFTRKQWLVTPIFAAALTNGLAILVTVALSRAFRIFIRVRERRNAPAAGQPAWPGHPERNNAEGRGWHAILEAFEEMFTLGQVQLNPPGQTTFLGKVRDFFQRFPERLRRGGLNLASGTLYLLLFVAFQACGVFTTSYLQTDGMALSDHPDCGTYVPRPGGTLRTTTPYEVDVQSDSANWARNCYNVDGSPDGCSFFLNQSIAYEVSDADCPFGDDLCLGGSTVPVRFTTGVVNARTIGINAAKTFEFNRTTVCSPLNMNETYIKLRGVDEATCRYTYDYHYGPANGSTLASATFQSYRDPNISYAPGYAVTALWSDGSPRMVWQPLNSLRPPSSATTTLIRVISQKIFYEAPSDDPIFPAHTPATGFPGYYWNLAGPGTIMACVDYIQARDPSTPSPDSWSPINQIPPGFIQPSDPTSRGALSFMINALRRSYTFAAFSTRTNAALDAQARIAGFASMPLASNQWKVEVEKLFVTSLARIQIEARNIARGVGARYPGFVKVNRSADFCLPFYMFNTGSGFVNLNYVGVVCVFAVSMLLVVCALPVGEQELFYEVLGRWFLWVGRRLRDAWRLVWPFIAAAGQTLGRLCKAIRDVFLKP